MEAYEIHITGAAGGGKVYHALLSSDYIAIRRANSLAGDDDLIEVWKGANCIFCDPPKTTEGATRIWRPAD